jgi:hypothetical protein
MQQIEIAPKYLFKYLLRSCLAQILRNLIFIFIFFPFNSFIFWKANYLCEAYGMDWDPEQ